MEASFWHQKWEKNEIGFHELRPHPFLVTFFSFLDLKANARVFVPLCGKSLDMIWLINQGYEVIGVELSPIAVEHFFKENNLAPKISNENNFTIYQADKIKIYIGDFFEFKQEQLGKIDAIYDRAALVALPIEIRSKYTTHLKNISKQAPILLISFEYDQRALSGPPFSISKDELKKHYSKHYRLDLLRENLLEGGLKGKCEAMEQAWHITRL